MAQATQKSIYDFTVKDIHGNYVSLRDYRNKWSGTSQLQGTELSVLYGKYKDQGLEILAFPCNQFLHQEPGSNENIMKVACTKFKAEYPIFDKVDVNGKKAAPLFKYLKSQKRGVFGENLKWNYTKFIVDKEGKVVYRYAPVTTPNKLEKDIQKLVECS